ncbi:MAG: hypothetical protein QHH75_10680 [Bacillota bacterium]|nr:hypothetical protein [Bacillota bacterium]
MMQTLHKIARKVRDFILTLAAWGTVVAPAWAVGGIEEKTAEDVASKVVGVIKDILMPIGAMVIFAAVAWTAFKIITTANKPNERAEAMAAIPYILGGGLVLGGVMLISGFIVGLMTKVGQ